MNRKLLYKILVVIFLLIVYRIGTLIIVPGLPSDYLYSLFIKENFNSYDAMRRFSLFGFGIGPYSAMASLLLIVSALSKKLRLLLMGDAKLQKKFERIIIALTLAYMFASALGLNTYMKSLRVPNLDWNYGEDAMGQALFISAKVCGGMVVIFIARLITRTGIINGMIALVLVDFFYQAKSSLAAFMKNDSTTPVVERLDLLTAIAIMGVLLIFFIVITIAKREVPLHDQEIPGNKQNIIKMPIRLNAIGTVPTELSSSIITLILYQIPQLFGSGYACSNTTYYSVTVILSMLLAFLFAYMNFNPANIASIIRRYNFIFPGSSGNESDVQYLKSLYRPIAGVSIAIALLLAITPLVMGLVIPVPGHFLFNFSGAFILMFCCIIIDCKYRFDALSRIDDTMAEACRFNTVLEANLFIDRLGKSKIKGIAVNTRALPLTGTFAYWEICSPSIPYFIMHRSLVGGCVAVFVNNNDIQKAAELSELFSFQEKETDPAENGNADAGDEEPRQGEEPDSLKSGSSHEQHQSEAEELLLKSRRLARKISKKRN